MINPIMYSDRKVIDLFENFSDILNTDTPDKKRLEELKQFLKNNKFHNIVMYHGTSKKHNITDEGIKRTTSKRRNSIQSGSGYVYLSLFSELSKNFAEIAYPRQDVSVYKVIIPIEELKPDKDQLGNKRLYSGLDAKDTLVDSLVYGHGACVKIEVPPYMIKGE